MRHCLAGLLSLLALLPHAALAQCPLVALDQHVVLLEFENPTGTSSPSTSHKTGVLVSDTGLVLTSFSLIGDVDLGPQDLLNFGSETPLQVRAWAKRYPDSDEAPGVVIGHDWRRDLLLIKLPDDRIEELGLTPVQLSRDPVSRSDKVCITGFLEEGEGFTAEPAAQIFTVRPDDQVIWRIPDHRSRRPEYGSAVIDARDGTLLGIVVGGDREDSLFLPIEYADTLLSQVFISRIMNDLRRIEESISRKMQAGLAWNYRMLAEPDESGNALSIRFYFDSILEEVRLSRIEVSTSLWGQRDGIPDQSVQLDSYRQTPSVRAGSNYIDYDAYDYIETAKDQGFETLSRIQIRLRPIFEERRPRGEGPQEPVSPRFTTFEFPLSIALGG